jgi:hypothetical protein
MQIHIAMYVIVLFFNSKIIDANILIEFSRMSNA